MVSGDILDAWSFILIFLHKLGGTWCGRNKVGFVEPRRFQRNAHQIG